MFHTSTPVREYPSTPTRNLPGSPTTSGWSARGGTLPSPRNSGVPASRTSLLQGSSANGGNPYSAAAASGTTSYLSGNGGAPSGGYGGRPGSHTPPPSSRHHNPHHHNSYGGHATYHQQALASPQYHQHGQPQPALSSRQQSGTSYSRQGTATGAAVRADEPYAATISGFGGGGSGGTPARTPGGGNSYMYYDIAPSGNRIGSPLAATQRVHSSHGPGTGSTPIGSPRNHLNAAVEAASGGLHYHHASNSSSGAYGAGQNPTAAQLLAALTGAPSRRVGALGGVAATNYATAPNGVVTRRTMTPPPSVRAAAAVRDAGPLNRPIVPQSLPYGGGAGSPAPGVIPTTTVTIPSHPGTPTHSQRSALLSTSAAADALMLNMQPASRDHHHHRDHREQLASTVSGRVSTPAGGGPFPASPTASHSTTTTASRVAQNYPTYSVGGPAVPSTPPSGSDARVATPGVDYYRDSAAASDHLVSPRHLHYQPSQHQPQQQQPRYSVYAEGVTNVVVPPVAKAASSSYSHQTVGERPTSASGRHAMGGGAVASYSAPKSSSASTSTAAWVGPGGRVSSTVSPLTTEAVATPHHGTSGSTNSAHNLFGVNEYSASSATPHHQHHSVSKTASSVVMSPTASGGAGGAGALPGANRQLAAGAQESSTRFSVGSPLLVVPPVYEQQGHYPAQAQQHIHSATPGEWVPSTRVGGPSTYSDAPALTPRRSHRSAAPAVPQPPSSSSTAVTPNHRHSHHADPHHNQQQHQGPTPSSHPTLPAPVPLSPKSLDDRVTSSSTGGGSSSLHSPTPPHHSHNHHHYGHAAHNSGPSYNQQQQHQQHHSTARRSNAGGMKMDDSLDMTTSAPGMLLSNSPSTPPPAPYVELKTLQIQHLSELAGTRDRNNDAGEAKRFDATAIGGTNAHADTPPPAARRLASPAAATTAAAIEASSAEVAQVIARRPSTQQQQQQQQRASHASTSGGVSTPSMTSTPPPPPPPSASGQQQQYQAQIQTTAARLAALLPPNSVGEKSSVVPQLRTQTPVMRRSGASPATVMAAAAAAQAEAKRRVHQDPTADGGASVAAPPAPVAPNSAVSDPTASAATTSVAAPMEDNVGRTSPLLAAGTAPALGDSSSTNEGPALQPSRNRPAAATPTKPTSSAQQSQLTLLGPLPPPADTQRRAATPRAPTSGPRRQPPTRVLMQHLAASWANRSVENQQAYREGGYLAVEPGDLIDGRFEAIRKLGWGEFSTVWLVFDHKARSGHKAFAALKAAKCRADIVQNTKYECNLLSFLRDARKPGIPICSINQTLEQRGQYGTHLCLTMPVLGPNLLCMVDYMKARRRRRSETEVQLMREITTAVLKALDHLAHLNVMHTDLKPENVMVSAPDPKLLQAVKDFLEHKQLPSTMLQSFADGDPFSSVVTVADFGLSILLEPPTTPQARQLASHRPPNVTTPGILSNTQVGMLMQTREYRAIEVLFGTDLNCRTDLWSLGCMVYELVTGDFLLNPKRKTRVEREMDIEHVAMIMQLLGPVPPRIARGPGRFLHRYFDTNTGAFLYAERYRNYQRRNLAAELSLFLEQPEAERCAQFIMACFSYDPAERPTAHELLKHPWLRASML